MNPALLPTSALVLFVCLPALPGHGAPVSPQDGDGGAVAVPAAPAQATMLRLRNGTIRWGSIDEHDPDGMVFRDLGTGGTARVPWSLLDPTQSEALRTEFGYVEVVAEELMIPATVLTLFGGEEVMGVIIDRTGDEFLIKSGGNLQAIPKQRVQATAQGMMVPALDVYTREELFEQYSAGIAEDDLEAQLELAELCERILDYQNALACYERVAALDPDYQPEQMALILERTRASADAQEQVDYLREVDRLRKRKLFGQALESIQAFDQLFPASPLTERARKLLAQVEKGRDEAVSELVRRRWDDHMVAFAREASRMETFAEALAYAQEQMSQDIELAVLEDVQKKLNPEATGGDVRRAWDERRKVKYKTISYGMATWLLGEDKARAGVDTKEEAQGPTSELDAARRAQQEKIQRFVKNQEMARRAKSQGDRAADYETYWAGLSGGARLSWIRAYYVEFSGDMELSDRVRFSNCVTCAGRGVIETIAIGGASTPGGQSRRGGGRGGRGGSNSSSGSGNLLQKCTTCQSVGVVRKVRYR